MGFQYRTKTYALRMVQIPRLHDRPTWCGRRAHRSRNADPTVLRPSHGLLLLRPLSTNQHSTLLGVDARRLHPGRPQPMDTGQPILAPCMARRCPSRSHSPTSHFSTTTACCGASSFPRCTIPFGLATRPCLQNGMSHLCAASKSAVLGWRRCGCRTRAARLARGVPRTSSPG